MQGDADGYDLVVVDAMHKANYASRICHSCRPNCEAKYVLSCYTLSSLLWAVNMSYFLMKVLCYLKIIDISLTVTTGSLLLMVSTRLVYIL